MAVSAKRTATAPKVPQNTAFFCRCFGSRLAAMAMTMALSPASTRSSRMMVSRPERKSGAARVIGGSMRVEQCGSHGRARPMPATKVLFAG